VTDERLRDLERRAQSGDEAAARELGLARLRARGVAPERLTLAASLGHPDACQLVGEPVEPLTPEDLFEAAPRWGWQAVTRALLALALEPHNFKVLAGYSSRLYRRALVACLAALEEQDAAARRAALQAADVDVPFTYSRWEQSLEGLRALCAARAAGTSELERVWAESLHAALDIGSLGVSWSDERWPLRYTPLATGDEPSVAERLAAAPEVFALLCAGAAAWALDEPLALRSDEVDTRMDALR
jgi:hypothetical protein